MSVYASARSESKVQYIEDAMKLRKYTEVRCRTTPNIKEKEYLCSYIKSLSRDIYTSLFAYYHTPNDNANVSFRLRYLNSVHNKLWVLEGEVNYLYEMIRRNTDIRGAASEKLDRNYEQWVKSIWDLRAKVGKMISTLKEENNLD